MGVHPVPERRLVRYPAHREVLYLMPLVWREGWPGATATAPRYLAPFSGCPGVGRSPQARVLALSRGCAQVQLWEETVRQEKDRRCCRKSITSRNAGGASAKRLER